MVTKIAKTANNQGQVTVEDVGGGNARTFTSDMVLVSMGRRPFVEGLGAKELGVKFNKWG
jgi:dihydrolipoamide dehydrogenase